MPFVSFTDPLLVTEPLLGERFSHAWHTHSVSLIIAMGLLYLFETSLDYHGMTSKELYKLWLKHAGEAFKLYEQGIMKYAFKVGWQNIRNFCSHFLSGNNLKPVLTITIL